MGEVSLALTWLYSTLSADGTLSGYAPGGVYRGMAPPLTATPYIIIALQSGSDITTMNAFRLMDDLLFQVKAVGPGSESTAISNAADRIDALIGGPSSATVTGGVVLSSYRQSPLEVDELVNGEIWNNQGGLYRLQVEKSS